jgi:hypothetical protein
MNRNRVKGRFNVLTFWLKPISSKTSKTRFNYQLNHNPRRERTRRRSGVPFGKANGDEAEILSNHT